MKVIFVISTGGVIPASLSPLLPIPDNHMCKFDNNIVIGLVVHKIMSMLLRYMFLYMINIIWLLKSYIPGLKLPAVLHDSLKFS